MPGLYQSNDPVVSQGQTFELVLKIGEGRTMQISGKFPISIALACMALLASDPAHALRCGNRLVIDGMHESEVRAICGEPISQRHLGYVLRSHVERTHGLTTTRYYGGYRREVLVTELVFNFGPRKLMRKMRFEDGILTSIETIGYGYREKRR
jgi:hypothetical protein